MKTAVIILNWNGAALLSEYLPQVLAATPPEAGTVIVADNGSTDSSLELMRRDFPHVPLWAFDKNYGFAGGYNRAVEMAGDYDCVVLLNSDVAPEAGWLEKLDAYMEAHPATGACQPKIRSYRHPERFEYAGACGGFIDRNGYPYCRGRIFDVCEEDRGQYNTEMEVHWATGACLMVRRELYLRTGGLDEAFFAHMEEIDLCWRIRLLGYQLAVVPGAVVRHLGGGSLPAENPRKTYLNFRNNLLMLHKNLPDSVRSRVLFRRRLLDTLAWAKYVVTFDWKNAGAILRAHRDFRRMRSIYNTHPAENLLPAEPDILKEFYLRGHKTFDALSGRNQNI